MTDRPDALTPAPAPLAGPAPANAVPPPPPYAADGADLRALASHWVGLLREECLARFSSGHSCGTSAELVANERVLRLRAALGHEGMEAVWDEADARTRAEIGDDRWKAFLPLSRPPWLREEAEAVRRAAWRRALGHAGPGAAEGVLVASDREVAPVVAEAWEAALAGAIRGGWLPAEDPAAACEYGFVPLTAAQAADLGAAMAWPVRRLARTGGMRRALRMMRTGPVAVLVVCRSEMPTVS